MENIYRMFDITLVSTMSAHGFFVSIILSHDMYGDYNNDCGCSQMSIVSIHGQLQWNMEPFGSISRCIISVLITYIHALEF